MSALGKPVATVARHLAPFAFTSVAATHAGRVRHLNEDACLNHPDVGLWAVADGMGGHAAGDVASRLVIDELGAISDFSSAFAFRRAVRSALLNANGRLQLGDDVLDLAGSTVVALIAHGGHYACIWAGDSRAYVLRRGRLERITRDHSLVQEMVDAGSLTAGEARLHRHRNIVTRAVGAAEVLELDGVYGRIEPGDRFLLCSDGLCTVLNDEDLRVNLSAPLAATAAQNLMRAALDGGAPDNVTHIVIDAASA